MKRSIIIGVMLAVVLFSCKKSTPINTALVDNYDFNTPTGQNPYGELIRYSSWFYGMTSAGGANGAGTIFNYNIGTGAVIDLHDFGAGTDGAEPMGDLTLVDTTLYGLTHQGGTNGYGVLFSMNVSGGNYKVLYNFGNTSADGTFPNGSLTLVGNLLYGMTSEGGVPGNGNIFSYNISDSTYTDIYDFAANGHQGVSPGGNVIVSGSTIYGMAYLGGGSANDGVVFSVSTAGTGYTNLVTFTGANGANPQGSLVLSGSTLYGTTNAGGANGGGNIFSVGTNGSGFKDLYDFNGATGPSSPNCTLVISGSTLYGTATGGADIGGYVFSIGTNGTGFTTLYAFDLGNTGSSPHGGLLYQNTSGNNVILWGLAYAGGKYGYGTIYAIPTTN